MTFRYRTLYQLSYNGLTYSLAHNAAGRELFCLKTIERVRRCALKNSSKLWWTGKDSNLRTSQGGTDLQSVGFNHSPTCPML